MSQVRNISVAVWLKLDVSPHVLSPLVPTDMLYWAVSGTPRKTSANELSGELETLFAIVYRSDLQMVSLAHVFEQLADTYC